MTSTITKRKNSNALAKNLSNLDPDTPGSSPARRSCLAAVTTETFTPQPATTATQPEPTATPRVASSWKMEVVAENLEIPWSIVFTSPERMLVSERHGTIREINAGQLIPQPVYTFADIASRDEAGLMGMAASPDYAADHFIYVCYSTSGGERFDQPGGAPAG